MIDPAKEIAASRDAIRSGLSSRSEAPRRLGYEPKKVEAEIAEENGRADTLRLSFDSDGRRPLNGPAADGASEQDRMGSTTWRQQLLTCWILVPLAAEYRNSW